MLEKIHDGAPQSMGETFHWVVAGFYLRQWRGVRGTLVFTMVHHQRHTFQVTAGKAMVWSPDADAVMIEAPHVGVTQPGTQRLLLVLEDIIWTTFHENPDSETDIPTLEARLVSQPIFKEALTP